MTDERIPDQPSIEDLTPLLRINKLCDQFQRAWRSGESPRIEDYVTHVSEGARETLLRNLLPIDIEARRRKAKESPSSDEYIKRFPRHARLIRQAFFESTMGSFHHDVSTPSVAATVSLIPAAKRLGDYELMGELGKGGFGVVYEARHVKRGDRVALKTLPLEAESHDLHSPATDEQKRKTGDRLMRFKREFRTLAGMNHPNLVGLHSLEADGDQWFFTMDLIEGTDFIDYVRPGGNLDEARLRTALPQLVAGVMALHSRNVIHRDLKPSNVMVSKDGRVQILDFGLVAELEKRTHTASIAGFVGTPAYAAPEQLIGKHTSASDWYSVGTILYEALVGGRPYPGYGVDVMAQKQEQDAPSIASDESVARDLGMLAMQLLARDPNARSDALTITHAVSADVDTDSAPNRVSAGSLIGRESHLAQLQESLVRVEQTGQAQLVFITGRSGEGKTSLVEHFLEPLRKDRKLVVLSGRCYDRESVPFKAIDGVIDALCSHLQRLPGEDVAALMPDDIAFLIQLFPVLQRIQVISRQAKPEIASMDRAQVLHRGFMALRLLLKRIGEHQTVIFFADDLQWGDTDSADCLWKLISGEDTPAFLFLGTYRSDEADESPFLLQLNESKGSQTELALPIEQISLIPLSVSECTQLMVDRLGRDDELIRQRAIEFHTKTGGNPYLLIELIGCFDPDTDSFEALALDEVIDRKLLRLPGAARGFLETLAVAGRAAAIKEITLAAEQDEGSASLIAHMRNENLVRLAGAEEAELVDTYHDKIRETVLDGLEAESLESRHLAMAHAIENVEGIDTAAITQSILGEDSVDVPASVQHRAGELAKHYEASGNTRQAFCYSLMAAEAAIRQFTLPVAVEFYTAAQRTLGDAPRAVQYRFAVGYGNCLRRIGKGERALELLDWAVNLSDDPIEVAEVEYLRGESLFQINRLVDSVDSFARALELVGVSFPKKRGAILWELTRERLIYLWNTRMQRREGGSISKVDPRLVITVKSLIQAQKPAAWRDYDQWVLLGMKAANLTFGIEHPSFRTIHFIGSFIAESDIRRIPEFLRIVDRLRIDLPKSADALLRAMANRMDGYLRAVYGDYSSSEKLLNQAGELLTDDVQDHYQLMSLRWWQSDLSFLQGKLKASADLASSTFDEAVTSGNDRIASNVLAVWTFASEGRIPFEELSGCFRSIEEDFTSQVFFHSAKAKWHLANGRSESAIAVAETGFEIFSRPGRYFAPYEAISPIVLARCLNRHAEERQRSDPSKSRALSRRATRVIRTILHGRRGKRSRWPQLPGLLREYAVAQAGLHRVRKALKLAERSCEIAELRGARYELAQSRLVVAELSQKLNLPDADQLFAAAKEGMVEFEQMIEANATMWERP